MELPMKQSMRIIFAWGMTLALVVICIPAWALPGILDKISLPKPGKDKPADEPAKVETAPQTIAKYTGPKKRLGIMDMEVKVTATSAVQPTTTGGVVQTTTINIPAPTDFGTGLTEMLTTSLVNTGRFICLERKAIADIQAEQTLMTSPLGDPTSAPPAGKLLGAQALIRGAVTEYTYTATNTGGSASFLKGISIGASKAEAAVVLDIRFYDAATGVILDSVKAEGRAKSSGKAIDIDKSGLKMSATGFSQTPLGRATREAIDKAVLLICKRMEIIPWEGRIADVEEDTIYVNAGSKVGLKEGDILQVVRPGKTIIDPETKTVIGRTKDTTVGVIKITSTMDGVSLASPTEGKGFQANDIVRYVDPKGKADQWTKPEGSTTPTPAPEPTPTPVTP